MEPVAVEPVAVLSVDVVLPELDVSAVAVEGSPFFPTERVTGIFL